MAIGTRIKQRLSDLEWQQKDLIDAASRLSETPISPQSISNLIRRDSARSEQDEVIADALGVNVMWLVYGRDVNGKKPQTFKYSNRNSNALRERNSKALRERKIKALRERKVNEVREPGVKYSLEKNAHEIDLKQENNEQEEDQSELLKELINLAKTMPRKLQIELIGQAKYLAMEHQRKKKPQKK